MTLRSQIRPVTEAQIKHMVDRFLGWRLPENFNPDGGISFKRTHSEQGPWGPQKYEPSGTNVFDAEQATAMVRYMLEGLPAAPKAFEDSDDDLEPTDAYREWLNTLEEDVIQGEFGYEPGEFTVYTTHWAPLYEEGLTPRQAWQRALDGFAQARKELEADREANYARIVSEDQAAIARERAASQE